MKHAIGLTCRECRREYSINPIHVRDFCLGPLEVNCDSGKIKNYVCFRKIDEIPNLWRRKKWKSMFESPLP